MTQNLWQQLLRESSTQTKVQGINLLLVGPEKSGKSMLLHRMKSVEMIESFPTYALKYSTWNIYDAQDGEDIVTRIGIWKLSDGRQQQLLSFACQPAVLSQSVAIVVVDLSKPWTIKSTLQEWTELLQKEIRLQQTRVPSEQKAATEDEIKRHFLSYEMDDLPTTLTDIPLPEHVLTASIGIPLVVVGCKSDEMPQDELSLNYTQHYLRRFCLEYGAPLFYTSAKNNINCDLLRKYLLSRMCPEVFPDFKEPPQLIEQDTIYVPCGYDSYEHIEQSLTRKWDKSRSFEEILPMPANKHYTALTDAIVKVDDDQVWLEKLELAGTNTLSMEQKSKTPISKKTLASTASSPDVKTPTPRSRSNSLENSDVNPAHLANFFNNLLNRSEKEKKSKELRSLAKQELSNLKQ